MENLLQENCIPCHGGVSPISGEEIKQYQPQIPDWSILNRENTPYLERCYHLSDFAAALVLAQRIGEIAEQQGHHPTLIVEWGKLTVQWWTHAINGLHRNDFIMARKTDQILEQLKAED